MDQVDEEPEVQSSRHSLADSRRSVRSSIAPGMLGRHADVSQLKVFQFITDNHFIKLEKFLEEKRGTLDVVDL